MDVTYFLPDFALVGDGAASFTGCGRGRRPGDCCGGPRFPGLIRAAFTGCGRGRHPTRGPLWSSHALVVYCARSL